MTGVQPDRHDRSFTVLLSALGSRLFLFGLVLVSTHLVSSLPYDTSSTLVFRGSGPLSSCNNTEITIEEGWRPSLLTKIFSRLASWDALYFTTISSQGYLWEHYHAFLPGYPASITAFSNILNAFGLLYPSGDMTLISGFFVSNISFIMCSLVLYQLSKLVLKDETLAFRSALVFTWSPANPFFFSLYTESLFALFSFSGMALAVAGPEGRLSKAFVNFVAACLFAVSTSIRSNGVVLCGYLLYTALHRAFMSLRSKKYALAIYEILESTFLSLICCLPLIYYLASAYDKYCVGFTRPWCQGAIPNIYSFVQNHYWNVGFLNYYRIHQIPNFLLAFPVLTLSFGAIYYFIKHNWQIVKTLGLFEKMDNRYHPKLTGFLSPINLVFIVHLFVLLLTSLPVIHIQVLTRFLFSQCPPLYWFVAYILSSRSSDFIKKVYITYAAVFNVLGMILFANFLPWT